MCAITSHVPFLLIVDVLLTGGVNWIILCTQVSPRNLAKDYGNIIYIDITRLDKSF